MLQTNSWACRQTLSAAVLQTNFVSRFCRQSLSAVSADKVCLHRKPWQTTLQTNFVCRKSAEPWPKCRQILQTNPADKPCLPKIRRKLGQNADKPCRQTLSAVSADKVCLHRKPWRTNSADKPCLQKIRRTLAKMQTNPADKLCLQKTPPKTGPKCRQILQTNLVKTENCRQLQKRVDKVCLPSLDKVCLS